MEESRIASRGAAGEEGLLLQLRTDRRLGHEWDDWDGGALPNGGSFEAGQWLFYLVAAALGVAAGLVAWGVTWLTGPRLAMAWSGSPGVLARSIVIAVGGWALWLAAVAVAAGTRWQPLPRALGEGGLLPRVLPIVMRAGGWMGFSRDRVGHSGLRIYHALVAKRSGGVAPDEALILLPRCLGKAAMQEALAVSSRYGVPVFVASRGRHARQMISLRRPKRVIAVACERDLVSGVHDVARRLPVLGATLRLPDGPCRNTELTSGELEARVRLALGL